jgi:hypothetical protein
VGGLKAVASGVVGALIGALVYFAVLIPAIDARGNLPHVYTAKELLTMPEGQLVYPGATIIRESSQDMIPPSISPEQPASVERELLITGSPLDVMPWYHSQLEPRGWTIAARTPSGGYRWTKGRLTYQLAVCGDGGDLTFLVPPPCTKHVLTDLWAY